MNKKESLQRENFLAGFGCKKVTGRKTPTRYLCRKTNPDDMKKIFKEAMRRYQNWRYRRLYRKLFWFYAKIKIDGDAAGQNAAEAFKWLTAIEYADLFAHRHKPDV